MVIKTKHVIVLMLENRPFDHLVKRAVADWQRPYDKVRLAKIKATILASRIADERTSEGGSW